MNEGDIWYFVQEGCRGTGIEIRLRHWRKMVTNPCRESPNDSATSLSDDLISQNSDSRVETGTRRIPP
ncbi:uncharacterized [Tachysurus ichikawai]